MAYPPRPQTTSISAVLCRATRSTNGIVTFGSRNIYITMSSLRDIIDDVDVEPLQYQAHIRSHRQRAAQDTVPPPISYSPSQSPTRDTKGKKSARHRRPHRSPKHHGQSSETSSRHHRDSDSAEGMDHRPRAYRQASATSSTRQSSRDGVDMGVKLTPVTRRVSRAKKGERVHNCDTCQKVCFNAPCAIRTLANLISDIYKS